LFPEAKVRCREGLIRAIASAESGRVGKPMMRIVVAFAFAGVLSSCYLDGDPALSETGQAVIVVSEGFEGGSKTAYAAGSVSLASGAWNLDDALIGTSTADAKTGSKAVRVRNSGRITVQFDVPSGISTVSVQHARYGSDANGSFALFVSQNGGSTWSQFGATVTTGASLATATFTVNQAGALRLQLRKMDGTSNRIDLDNVVVQDYGGTPPPDPDPAPSPGADVSVHTTLGLPSDASTASWNDYLSVKSQYVISYNSARKGPNWVSWQLDAAYLGSAARQDSYRIDDTLPAGMPQATPSDYSGTGWDRGHMCPSGDRTKTASANSQTFYLSNMLPQATESNGGPWAQLETYSRNLATAGRELFIIAGGRYVGGAQTIGNGVEVPDDNFKVIVVLDHPGQGAADVTSATRVIGVLVPNDDAALSPGDDWRSFRIPVRDIEEFTGLDLLSDVDPGVQDIVEQRVDDL